MKNNDLAFLNIFRFVGSVFVACFLHFYDHTLLYLTQFQRFSNGILNLIATDSFIFVEMFFMISGILFSLNYKDKIASGTLTFGKFMKKRVLRLWPCIIASTIVMYILNVIYYANFNTLFRFGTLRLSRLIMDISVFNTTLFGADEASLNAPIWYIGVLMLCYVIAYFIAKKSKKVGYFYALFIFIGVALLYKNTTYIIFNTYVARGLFSFFLGALVFNDGLVDKFKSKANYFVKSMLLIIPIIFITLIYFYESYLCVTLHDKVIAYDILFFLPLIVFFYRNNIVNKVCDNKFFNYLGNISYGIYIWNFPIIISEVLLINLGIIPCPSKMIFLIVNLIIHIVIATLSYIFIEKKFKKIKC